MRAPLPAVLPLNHHGSSVVYHVFYATTSHATDRCPENLGVSVFLVQTNQTMSGLWFLRICHMAAIPRYYRGTVD